MNNPNPFVPKGSLLEQQNKRRTHMKLGVLCVLSVSVAGLMVMLIQGCTKKSSDSGDTTLTPTEPTNAVATAETNPPPTDLSNPPTATPPTNIVTTTPPPTLPPVTPTVVTPPPVAPPTPPPTPEAGAEYTVVKGDSPAKIAKKAGVSLKALMAANPDVKPTKLKVGQKLVIPAGGKTTADATSAPGTPTADTGGETYIVKSGDTLTKIAKAHHVKVKALMAANGLTTSQIKVGKSLKIPSKAEATAAAAPVAAPVMPDTTPSAPPAPMPAVPTAPAPSTPPAPGAH